MKTLLTLMAVATGLIVITGLLLAAQAAPSYAPQWMLETDDSGIVILGGPVVGAIVIWCITTFCTTIGMIVVIQESK